MNGSTAAKDVGIISMAAEGPLQSDASTMALPCWARRSHALARQCRLSDAPPPPPIKTPPLPSKNHNLWPCTRLCNRMVSL